MKLMIVIVQEEDASRCIGNLMDAGFSATRLSTTGGFLRAGNTTLLLGVQDTQVEAAMRVIEQNCSSRRQMTSAAQPIGGTAEENCGGWPIEVTIGGATVFVLNVEQFVKL